MDSAQTKFDLSGLSEADKEEVRHQILQTEIDKSNVEYLGGCLHLFDKETKKAVCDKIALYAVEELKANPAGAYCCMGIIADMYHKMGDKKLSEELAKTYLKVALQAERHDDDLYRAWTETVMEYYVKHRNE